ncbi:hypothetical protein [Streptomyces zagrosensis]|uniref:Uncharacterized protein n=1 Tax=Streptomyces zagrosensis TaxID=1042984 RepID=A0A7W9V2V0_9ACTN|nr:hypothetical protein [Streptomyces zagrosensis]MBB5939239.1 hypothetical protein [Streptomyces zagrosensis]
MTALWRSVLSALSDPAAADREQVLAHGAVALALQRDLAATPTDVLDDGLHEFGITLGAATTTAALDTRRAALAQPG